MVSNRDTSLNSKSSSYKSLLSRRIKAKRMSCNLQYFSILGFLSLFVLILVNWLVFSITFNGITSFSNTFQKICYPMIMYMKTLDTMRSISYYYLMRENAPSIDRDNEYKEMNITKID